MGWLFWSWIVAASLPVMLGIWWWIGDIRRSRAIDRKYDEMSRRYEENDYG